MNPTSALIRRTRSHLLRPPPLRHLSAAHGQNDGSAPLEHRCQAPPNAAASLQVHPWEGSTKLSRRSFVGGALAAPFIAQPGFGQAKGSVLRVIPHADLKN